MDRFGDLDNQVAIDPHHIIPGQQHEKSISDDHRADHTGIRLIKIQDLAAKFA